MELHCSRASVRSQHESVQMGAVTLVSVQKGEKPWAALLHMHSSQLEDTGKEISNGIAAQR